MTDPSDGFRLRAEAVARAITPRTKLLIVNSPSNPSGAVVPPMSLRAFTKSAARKTSGC